jgi:hypothetical protein
MPKSQDGCRSWDFSACLLWRTRKPHRLRRPVPSLTARTRSTLRQTDRNLQDAIGSNGSMRGSDSGAAHHRERSGAVFRRLRPYEAAPDICSKLHAKRDQCAITTDTNLKSPSLRGSPCGTAAEESSENGPHPNWYVGFLYGRLLDKIPAARVDKPAISHTSRWRTPKK